MTGPEQLAAIRAGRCWRCNVPFSVAQVRRLAGSPGENATCAECGAEVIWIAYQNATERRWKERAP